jgi:hypothetical protein
MGGLVLAWMIGEGLITWRSVSEQHMPPSPRQLLFASILFAGLGVVAEYAPARTVATAFAFGVDLAVLLKVLPGSGTSVAITVGKTSGWSSIAKAGNTVLIPDGTAASEVSVAASGTSTSTRTSTSGGAISGSASQIVTQLAGQVGWNAAQIKDWLAVLQIESGGNPNAKNPSSGAYGAAQAYGHGTSGTACPKTGENNYGGYGLTTAQAQAANCGNLGMQLLWMKNYIQATYTTPSGALASEHKNGAY